MTRHGMLLSATILTAAAVLPCERALSVEGVHLAQAAPAEPQQQKPGQKPPQKPAARPAPPGAQQQPPHQPPAAAAPPAAAGQQAPAAATTPPPGRTRGNPAVVQNPPPGPVPNTPPGRTPPGRTPPVGQQRQNAPAVVQTPPPPAPPGVPPAAQQPGTPAVVQTPPPARPVAPAAAQPRPGTPAVVQTPPAVAPAAVVAPLVGQPRPGVPAAPAAVVAPLVGQPRPGVPAAPVVVNVPVDPRTVPQHLEQLRGERHEIQDGNRLVIQEADRTIVREGGHDFIRHDEAGRFRFNARDVNVERRGNLTISIAVRPDGSRIITEVDQDGRLVRRLRRDPLGREEIIIDNTFEPRGPGFAGYFVELPPPAIRIPRELYIREANRASMDDIYATLMAPPVDRIERRYALDEIRYSEPLRARMPRVDIDTVNFETGSWEVSADQVERLAYVAQGMLRSIQRNPREVFMVEGYTDAVGNDVDNLSLSDRRAESVAVILTNVYMVPPENMVTQGYGKQFLKVPTDAPERANRRVAVQRITPLLVGQN